MTEISKFKRELTETQMLLGDKEREIKAQVTRLREINKEKKTNEDKYNRLKSLTVPKLSKARDNVDAVVKELKEIREDSELLPDMFKKEKKDNDRYCKFMDEAKKERDEAVNMKDSLVAKRDDLQLEVDRKIRLTMVTQAANLAMKSKLEGANKSIKKLEIEKREGVEKMRNM